MKTKEKSLKDKLDKIFSEYIRLRDSDGEYLNCISCGSRLSIKESQCGHLVSRRNNATRWDEHNAAGQCFACNVWRNGNTAYMMRAMEDKFGREAIDEVIKKSRQSVNLKKSDLENMLLDLQNKFTELKASKGIS